MNLKEKISDLISRAWQLREYVETWYQDEVEMEYYQDEFEKIINEDFSHINPSELISSYTQYFESKALPIIKISRGQIFYRARIGYNSEYWAEDDLSKEFITPYCEEDISAPPPIYASGGRFNREGTSYLYIADNVKTCLAEVHLQVGQICSVSEFEALDDIEMIDLTKFNNDIEMKAWLRILMQPIHCDIVYKYNITRFLSDVFKNLNNKGIYFSSVQSIGNNIVCFCPDLFRPIKYSSKMYTASKITYDIKEIRDSIDEYVRKGTRDINTYNEYKEQKSEEKLEYFEKWVQHRKRALELNDK